MHVELDRLRRELRQKIFVGLPAGEAFAEARPGERLERLREAERSKGDPVPPKPPRKSGQPKISDY